MLFQPDIDAILERLAIPTWKMPYPQPMTSMPARQYVPSHYKGKDKKKKLRKLAAVSRRKNRK